MIDVLRQTEDTPATYPDVPAGLSEPAAALDANALWARIEAYTAQRFTDRDVVWVISTDGPDEWRAPLGPVTSHMAEMWSDGAWVPVTLSDGPIGVCLPSAGPYRITASVGAGPVPAPVTEAFRRLAEYSAEITKDGLLSGHASHTSHDGSIGPDIKEGFSRSANWAARAMINSGAADLLRPYRRA